MSKNYINVSVSTGKPTRVSVSTPANQQNVDVTRDTSAYNAEIAKQWATSEILVLNEDYSSKYYANKSKGYAQNAESFESATRETYNSFVSSANSYIEELTKTKEEVTEEISMAASDGLLDIRNAKEEAATKVENTRVNAIDSINTVKNEAVDSINSIKTTAINDIEFVAEGEKQEIQELADEIKDNGDTVNIAINAGVERLNSIDALKKSQITNCITEIPQRIKLELNNGTLTLKAGSEVIIPNGVGVFEEYTLPKDITSTSRWTTDKVMLVLNENKSGFYSFLLTNQYSGSSEPTTKNDGTVWFDTVNNVVKRYNGSNWVSGISLPIGIVGMTNGVGITGIGQVFNGFGFIGRSFWVDKGVKYLYPNGRNEDGSLLNVEVTTPELSMNYNQWAGVETRRVMLHENGGIAYEIAKHVFDYEQPTITTEQYWYYYDEQENYWKRAHGTDPNNWTKLTRMFPQVYLTTDAEGNFVEFTNTETYRALDWNDYKNNPHIVETYKNGASGYRIWSDGYCEQWGLAPSGSGISVALLRAFMDTNYNVQLTIYKNDTDSAYSPYAYPTSTTSFTIKCNGTGCTEAQKYWRACGYVYDFN